MGEFPSSVKVILNKISVANLDAYVLTDNVDVQSLKQLHSLDILITSSWGDVVASWVTYRLRCIIVVGPAPPDSPLPLSPSDVLVVNTLSLDRLKEVVSQCLCHVDQTT